MYTKQAWHRLLLLKMNYSETIIFSVSSEIRNVRRSSLKYVWHRRDWKSCRFNSLIYKHIRKNVYIDNKYLDQRRYFVSISQHLLITGYVVIFLQSSYLPLHASHLYLRWRHYEHGGRSITVHDKKVHTLYLIYSNVLFCNTFVHDTPEYS